MNIALLRITKGNWCLLVIKFGDRKYAWFGRSVSNVFERAQKFVDGAQS